MFPGVPTPLRVLLLSLLVALQAMASTLIPAGSTWRFHRGTNEPSPANLPAWRQSGYNDDSWALGPAPFHYGEPAFAGTGTELVDMQGGYTTVYLRRAFRVNDPGSLQALTLRATLDDGIIVWINGRRVATVNAPDSDAAATNGAVALSTVEYGAPTDYDLGLPSSSLVPGINSIAILLLNSAIGSSDVVFDAELVATERPTVPPAVLSVSPAPGVVSNLTSVTVGFTRAVTGVAANQFLLGGVPATGVTGAGATYTFTFPQPAWGTVNVTWGPLHAITDLSTPAVRFDASGAGSTWNYELVDPVGPAVLSRLPAPGLALRRLAEVEVQFNRPMSGVDARDLRLNGVPATRVSGIGAGPYRFQFAPAAAGTAVVSWAPDAGIVSDDAVPRPFSGGGWSYLIDPSRPAPAVRINEIMAENLGNLRDEDGDVEDWIELVNEGPTAVNLAGWTLSNDARNDELWRFPSLNLPAGRFVVVFASGKDRPGDTSGRRPHTGFKLNPNGGVVRLLGPELPRSVVDSLDFPEQTPDFAYGRVGTGTNAVYRFFTNPTPGAANGASLVQDKTDEVHFSVERGLYASPFRLSLACPTPDAVIRFTTNGSPPSIDNGFTYATPILINASRAVRAAAFAPGLLPSRIRTHTYLYGLPATRRLLPAVSLVTDTNNLYGRTGIMEYNPRNTANHGVAWERPVSVEWIRPEDNGGFHTDAGLRVAGGDYIRGLYNYRAASPPENKYSFRLYFRGEYGQGRLNFPVFPGTTVDSFDTIHLRAGMNDNTNPLLKDEFVRTLCAQVGLVACHGTFVHLFLNGVYKGIYNPAERVNEDFLKAYHGGGDSWDVLGPNNQAIGGDNNAWNALRVAVRRDLTVAANYVDVTGRMDLENFVDYLLPHIWADDDDWPHNNTRAARERVPGARFRFYPWDAEFSFGSHDVTYDTIANTLSSTSPPWGTTDYQLMFNSLKRSPEFRLLFADRVHRAFFNDGPLTDARIRAAYEPLRARLAPSISGYSDVITPWINSRRRHVTNAFQRAGFLASSNAPAFNRLGGTVPAGFSLVMTNLAGTIWFTTNGTDPRAPFTSAASSDALRYTAPLGIPAPVRIRARTLSGTNWSALTDATYTPGRAGIPIRFSELMYNPPGGDAYEFVELQNTGGLPVNVSGFQFNGIGFRFPDPTPPVPAGGRIVVANNGRTNLFTTRYPGVAVSGWYDGSLGNGGERLELLDRAGRVVASVEYGDSDRWPREADGLGASLENIRPDADPDNPANWQAGPGGGSPGASNRAPVVAVVQINELRANGTSDWIELRNPGRTRVSLAGWSLSDDADPRQFVFPAGTTLEPGAFLVLHSTISTNSGALRAPFRLDRSGEVVALFDAATNRADVVRYGAVPDGFTLGRNASGTWTLCEPTPASPNEPVLAFGRPGDIAINEFVANPDGGDDWLELHNTGSLPVGLEGWSVMTSNSIALVGSPIYIAPGGFAVLHADGNAGADHLDLHLPAAGGFIALLDPLATEFTRVAYAAQASGTVLARIPDGTGSFQSLSFSETPGASNRVAELGRTLRLAEFMANGTPDWIEIDNVSTNILALAGLGLQVDPRGAPPARIPLGAVPALAPGSRVLVYCGQLPPGFRPAPGTFLWPVALPDDGAVLSLFDPLGRLLDRVEYGPQIAGRSLVRILANWLLSARNTPGELNSNATELSNGAGLRINEWLATGTATNEFVELFNGDSLPANLTRWVLTDDPSVSGATNRVLPPLGFIGGGGFLRFRVDGSDATVPGTRLSFRLDALGETLRLIAPGGAVADSVDYVAQDDGVSEGRFPDGGTNVVRFPGSATPGAANRTGPLDTDGDGIPDDWERANGLRPDLAADALLDTDGDGLSNRDEYRAGTDPRDASSRFLGRIGRGAGDGLELRFTAGADRSYSVLVADSLVGTWIRISDIPAGVARDITVSLSPNATATRLYRITTPALP